VEPPPELEIALQETPVEVLFNKSYVAVYDSERTVREIAPDFSELLCVETHGAIVTAPGDDVDFVSRFFAPDVGINEDPVTGYAHTILVPYWAQRLGKRRLRARQVSARGGELVCEDRGVRVGISGQAVLYLEGSVHLP